MTDLVAPSDRTGRPVELEEPRQISRGDCGSKFTAIYVRGVPSSDGVPGGGPRSLVFLAEPVQSAPATLRRTLAALRAGAGRHRFIAWVPAQSAPVVIHHDDRRVTNGAVLPGGVTVRVGAPVEVGTAAARVGELTIGLEAAAAGTVSYEPAGFDPWIRYFFASDHSRPTELQSLRFRVLTASVAAAVQLDPARPFDSERSRAELRDAVSVTVDSTFTTRWGSPVALASRPGESTFVLAWDPASREAYWTLNGVWSWSTVGTGPVTLLPGLSGAEYLQAPSSSLLRFVSDSPAYASGFTPARLGRTDASPGFPLQATIPGVEHPVRTPWLYVEPPPGEPPTTDYYSQPDIAGLFRADPDGPFLNSLVLPSARLPSRATGAEDPPPSFPAVPYAGLETELDGALVRRFEIEVLNAARSRVIHNLEPARHGPRGLSSSARSRDIARSVPRQFGATAPTGPTGPITTAVTPQGLLSVLSEDLEQWRTLVLAQGATGGQRLVLTDVHGALREALMANQLFLVVSDVGKLRQHCSTEFTVTGRVLELGKRKPLSLAAVEAVSQLRGRVYASSDYFAHALDEVLQGTDSDAREFFLEHAEAALLAIGGWTFDLSAWCWKDPTAPTMMIIKFVEGDLEALIGDLSRWTQPSEFNDGDGAEAQARLLEIVRQARQDLPRQPDLQYFVDTVLGGPEESERRPWNGVLFLNPVVPTDALPADLVALAAGLPNHPVRAHHLGVTMSSFELTGTTIVLDNTALFGLLLYKDDNDLVYKGSAYDFKVLALNVRFANSTIASYSSQVELLVGQLFNELSTLQDSVRGDNVVLNGTLERGAYQFTCTTLNHFAIASRVLEFVEISRARFVTLVSDRTATRTVARFIFEGTLAFRDLGAADLFGYGPTNPDGIGGLGYSGLMVSMEFDPADPEATRRLEFIAGQTTFDPTRCTARSGSLPRRFPLSPAALHQSERRSDNRPSSPADLGFLPVEAPVPTGALGEVWFGLELTMSFGSPGALAPTLGFTGALLLSWAPSADGPNMAVGLRIPGSSGSSRALTIMGPLKLTIGSLDLLRNETAKGDYLLRLANVALSFMGMRFPSGGEVNASLFGNPDRAARTSALGWYAAYAKDPADGNSGRVDGVENMSIPGSEAPHGGQYDV